MVNRERMENLRYRVNRALIWVFQYWKELFNFRFDRYMIIQVLPGAYGLALVTIALALGYLIIEAFLQSTWRGLFYLFLAGPLSFLVAASVLRALLEFYMVVFRIAEQMDELVGMRDTVDRLSGISDSVDEMANLTRRLPFWRTISRRRNTRGRVPEQARKARRGGPGNDRSQASDAQQTDGPRDDGKGGPGQQ